VLGNVYILRAAGMVFKVYLRKETDIIIIFLIKGVEELFE
jgi:hypothetical protein